MTILRFWQGGKMRRILVLGFLMVSGSSLFLGCGEKEKPKGVADLDVSKGNIRNGSGPDGDLGGGYKNAKWGMSPIQVKNVLKGEIIDSGERDFISYIEYNIGAGKTLKCWFYKNRFYQVWYNPRLKDDDELGAEAVLRALTKKYGTGKILKGAVTFLGLPRLTIIWDDGITEIEYTMYDPDPYRYPSEWRHLYRKSSSLWVSYTNKKIQDNINREEKAKKEHLKEEKLRQKMKAIEEDL